MTAVLRHHTRFRYFTTLHPYRKLIASLFTALIEKAALTGYKNDRDLIDVVVSTGLRKAWSYRPVAQESDLSTRMPSLRTR